MDTERTRLTRKTILFTVLSVAVFHFGGAAYNNYQAVQQKIRIAEMRSTEQARVFEYLRFASTEETKRAKMLHELVVKRDETIQSNK